MRDPHCPAGASDLASTDPLLSRFQADATRALLSGSPAIDAGTNTDCPATDERGMPRPQNGICDIGAYERRIRVKWWPAVLAVAPAAADVEGTEVRGPRSPASEPVAALSLKSPGG